MKTLNLSKYIFLFILLLSPHGRGYPQSGNRNYIVTRTFLSEDGSRYNDQIQYFDRLNRPTQTVLKQFTPGHNDLIAMQEYDHLGLSSNSWIATPSTQGNGEFISDFPTMARNYHQDNNPYSVNEYELSPQKRVLTFTSTGEDWHNGNRYQVMEYLTNDQTRILQAIHFSVEPSGALRNNGYYPSGKLQVQRTCDEDNKYALVFVDKSGRKILERKISSSQYFDTYYVYDNLNHKRYVLPPLASDAVATAGLYPLTEGSALEQYAYYYRYDDRRLCIERKFPGIKPVYMAYDSHKRLILSQTGNQRNKGVWTATKYDLFGRVAYTTEIETPSPHAEMVHYFKDKLFVEHFSPTPQPFPRGDTGYSSNYYSDVPNRMLIVNYYNNYDFLEWLPPSVCNNLSYQAKPGYGNSYSNATGLLTGTRTYLLNDPEKYITAAIYYDEKGQIVQQRSTNILGGYDIVYNEYNFTGNLLKAYKEQRAMNGNNPIITTEVYRHTYDHASRLVKTIYKLNNQDSITLAENIYDEQGRLATRYRHNQQDTLIQEYNIRDWVTRIKNGSFEEDIFYNTSPNNSNPYYNGNISATRRKYNGGTHGYEYYYDGLNRLTEAIYHQGEDMVHGNNAYDEMFNYDKHGNITGLFRANPSYGPLDVLNMYYQGNQLIAVFDEYGSRNRYDVMEYQGTGSSSQSFWYDDNGNMTTDLDKNIVTIRYNILNLPDTVQFKNGNQLVNTYTADGRKLRMDYFTVKYPLVVPIASVCQLRYEYDMVEHYADLYLDNIHYTYYADTDATYLDYIRTGEGYVELKNPVSHYYYYYRRDHLGNNCESVMVMGDRSGVTQRTQYYPSGVPWAEGFNPSRHPYKFGDKELVGTHGYDRYDFTGRMYYSPVMRFDTPDPMAEKYYDTSLYAYCGNNPVNRIDPTGLDYWSTNDPDEIKRILDTLKTVPSKKEFEFFNFSSWNHATDAEFLGNLSFNDETNKFYTSYTEEVEGELVVIGVSFDGYLLSNTGVASVPYGFYYPQAGNMNNIYPEFALFMGIRGVWTGLREVAKGRSDLREDYVKEVEGLSSIASQMRASGSSSEEIARALHSLRRALGVKYKARTPKKILQKIHERNIKRYNDKLGPSIEYLRDQNKTWDDIIESATRTGGKDLGF